MPSRKHKPGAAAGAAAASGADAASGSNDDDVYRRVIDRVIEKLQARAAQGAAENTAIDEVMKHIDMYQSAINQQVGIIESNKKEIESVSKSARLLKSDEEMLDRINASKKIIVESENNIKHLMSIQELLEYKLDFWILKETEGVEGLDEKVKNLEEKYNSLHKNIQIRDSNRTAGTTMHANTKLNIFKESSLSILTGLYTALNENFYAAIENLANKIIELIDQQLIDRQIKESNRGKHKEPRELVDLYMLTASSILDGFNDEDLKSNKYIIWLKDDWNTDLGDLRTRIEKRLKQLAEQHYGIVKKTATGDVSGAAIAGAAIAGAAQQLHPEGGTSEGGGRRKKTRRSRHKKQVTAKYRK
jgi:hypothetical protein